jgi:hypothetical protein
LDKFTKYTLLTLVIVVAALTVSAYVSYQVGGNSATDDNVNTAARGGSTIDVYYNPFTVEPWGVPGENIGFTAVGCFGGLVAGYFFASVFESDATSRRKN